MKRHTPVALLATLISAAAWGQDVTVFGTTMAEMWKSDVPGAKAAYTPATQFLGIDATKLGSDALSLHLFGWGRTDLEDFSSWDGQRDHSALSYGYLQYQFSQANAEIKAGRFTVNQSTGFEHVDGIAGRTDLIGGFNVSGFVGQPVLFYPAGTAQARSDYKFQRDLIMGTRLGWRLGGVSEIGVSYLQDGTKSVEELGLPAGRRDWTRKQMGADIVYTPLSFFNLRGRTVWDLANRQNGIAEQDYTATFKVGGQVTVTTNYAERKFAHFYAGTTLPSLFKQDTNDLFEGWGGKVTWNTPWSVQMVADYQHMHRESYGDVNKGGGELRWANGEKTLQLGAAGHVAIAAKTKAVDATAPYRSLSYGEARAWAMASKGKFSFSLDGIVQRYSKANPYLLGISTLSEVVASVGYEATKGLKLAGDVSHATTGATKSETRGILRAEYHFGMSGKGGH